MIFWAFLKANVRLVLWMLTIVFTAAVISQTLGWWLGLPVAGVVAFLTTAVFQPWRAMERW